MQDGERRSHAQGVFWGTMGLFALFLGTYMTLVSQASHARPTPEGYRWLPLLFAVGFMVATQLFRLMLRCRMPSGALFFAAFPTLLCAAVLCVLLRAPQTSATVSGLLNSPLEAFSHNRALGVFFRIVLMVLIEEGVKLTPVVLLVLAGAVRQPRVAMLCAAIAGMSFGMIEAINYSVFIYPATGSPLTSYLVRTMVMAPSHGVGTAIGCGFMFFAALARSGGRSATPRLVDALLGFLAGVVLHMAHNALQAAAGPVSQVLTIFLQLAVLYSLVKAVEKDAATTTTRIPPAAEPERDAAAAAVT
jgi:hypothetical protein